MQNDRLNIYPYIGIALLLGSLLFASLYPITTVGQRDLIIDVATWSILTTASLIGVRLLYASDFFMQFSNRQRIVNYISTVLITLGIVFGINFLIDTLFIDDWILLMPYTAFKLLVSLLTFIIMIQACETRVLLAEKITQEEEEETELINQACEEIGEQINDIETIERITIKNGTKITIIPIEEVIHLQAEGDYIKVQSTKGNFLKEQTMKSMELQLPSDKFVRVHRSSIINIDYITQVEQYGKQSQLLRMNNGMQVKISLSGYKRLKETLGL